MKTYPASLQHPNTTTCMMMQVPVISTGHFTQEEAERLHNQLALMNDNATDGGMGQTCIICILDEFCFKACTAETRAVMDYFRTRGYTHLRLDPDGDVVPDLPTFQW